MIYLLGAAFVGIAYNPFLYQLIAAQIGLDTYLSRKSREARLKQVPDRLGLSSKQAPPFRIPLRKSARILKNMCHPGGGRGPVGQPSE